MTYIPAADLFTKYPKISMFRASVQRGWGGLTYLIKNKYPLVDAMQDAMDLKQFVQVLDLLEQIPLDTDISVTNEQGKNLFHILAEQASHFDEYVKEIYQMLTDRKVNPAVKDKKG